MVRVGILEVGSANEEIPTGSESLSPSGRDMRDCVPIGYGHNPTGAEPQMGHGAI
jgi:hypothetical protein